MVRMWDLSTTWRPSFGRVTPSRTRVSAGVRAGRLTHAWSRSPYRRPRSAGEELELDDLVVAVGALHDAERLEAAQGLLLGRRQDARDLGKIDVRGKVGLAQVTHRCGELRVGPELASGGERRRVLLAAAENEVVASRRGAQLERDAGLRHVADEGLGEFLRLRDVLRVAADAHLEVGD